MRVLFTCTQGAGHLRPLMPYARALRRGGHDVRIASPSDARKLIENAGFAHLAFERPTNDALAAIWSSVLDADNATMTRVVVSEIYAGRAAQDAFLGLRQIMAGWSPDIILRDSLEFGGLLAALEGGIPHARVAVHNGFSEARLVDAARTPLNARRKEFAIGGDVVDALEAEIAFTAFPASFDGQAPGFNAGPPWRVNQAEGMAKGNAGWMPRSDRPLVYTTFGTVAGHAGFETDAHRATIKAVSGLDIEVLMTTGPHVTASELGPLPANVSVEAFVPQVQVLRHARAMICHGGSGTLVGGFAAGIPILALPLFADQPENAERLQAAGLGLMCSSSDPSDLRTGLIDLLASDSIATRARAVAQEMAELPSLADAAAKITSLAG